MKFENKETEDFYNIVGLFYGATFTAPPDEVITKADVETLIEIARMSKRKIFFINN